MATMAPTGVSVAPSDKLTSENAKNLSKLSDLPVYDLPERYEYYVEAPCGLENKVSALRQTLNGLIEEYMPVYEKAVHICETGRAHTKESIYYLREEQNIVARTTAIAAGGLTGLLIARRRGFFKKLLYSSAGAAAVASVCYPREAVILSKAAGLSIQKAGLISYHFIKGVGEPKEPKEPKKPSIPSWITSEGKANGDAVDKLSQMVSDVWLWGFRLFERKPKEVTSVKESEPPKVVDVTVERTVTSDEPVKEAEVIVESTVSSDEPANEVQKVIEETTAALLASVISEVPSPAKDEILIKDAEIVKEKQQIEGDMGQSSLEDKELYTTRT